MARADREHRLRKLRWQKVKGPRAVTAVAIATALGAGLSPFAPGTMGTLVALPITYWINPADWTLKLLLWLVIFAIGIWAAKVFDQIMGSKDNGSIVIDEVVGYGISAWTAGRDPAALILAFFLFRVFDILKPPPVRQMDRWSKKKASAKGDPRASWWGGFGVLADDVLAGLMAAAVLIAAQRSGILH